MYPWQRRLLEALAAVSAAIAEGVPHAVNDRRVAVGDRSGPAARAVRLAAIVCAVGRKWYVPRRQCFASEQFVPNLALFIPDVGVVGICVDDLGAVLGN